MGAMAQEAGGHSSVLAIPAAHELPGVSLPQFPPSAIRWLLCLKLLNLGKTQSGLARPMGKRQGGRARCRDLKGVGRSPSPKSQLSRDARQQEDGAKSQRPLPQPTLCGTTATHPPRSPSPQSMGGFGGSTHSNNPFVRVSPALSSRLSLPWLPGSALVPPPLPRRRRSMAGEAGGEPGEEEAQAEDADIGRQPG